MVARRHRSPGGTTRKHEKMRHHFYLNISLSTHPSQWGICLRSSVKEITAISTSILWAGLLRSVSWYSGNYPGWVIVLSAMTRLR